MDLFKTALGPADCAALAQALGHQELCNPNLSYSSLGTRALRLL